MRDLNSLNRVILLGRLGKKPEIRVLPQTGRSVANFTMATNERLFNKATSETKDRTEWHRIVVWGPQAEFCEKYLDKGRQVIVEGKLRTRTWQDRDGVKKTTTEIEAQNITLVGGGRSEGAPEGTRGGYVPDAEAPSDFPGEDDSAAAGAAGGEGDDDLPPF
jgi:single-strand DNA-binding protein